MPAKIKGSDKQINIVLDALTAGCRTSAEIAKATGLPRQHVCGYGLQ